MKRYNKDLHLREQEGKTVCDKTCYVSIPDLVETCVCDDPDYCEISNECTNCITCNCAYEYCCRCTLPLENGWEYGDHYNIMMHDRCHNMEEYLHELRYCIECGIASHRGNDDRYRWRGFWHGACGDCSSYERANLTWRNPTHIIVKDGLVWGADIDADKRRYVFKHDGTPIRRYILNQTFRMPAMPRN